MKGLIKTTAVFIVLIVAVCAGALLHSMKAADNTGSCSVRLNEIEKLCEQGDTASAREATHELRKEIRAEERKDSGQPYVLIIGCISILFVAGVSLYYGIRVVRPFYKLSDFAEAVAGGELDMPLEYERKNVFGKFTWAFDSMRNEIAKARACEREAIENHKTVIASLSHDIKTPVASIRAYTEALEMGIGSSPESCMKYIDVIIRKCDEVSKLTSDMLTHSLSEMDKLKMSPEEFDLGELLADAVTEFSPDDSVRYEKPQYPLMVYADRERVRQIAENLINNARKYAKTDMEIILTDTGEMTEMHFRDHGSGIPPEDLPFIFGKFYRGSNAGSESGAGLGLYIVKYIAEQSGGRASARNTEDGFEVTVSLPVSRKP